MTPSDSCYSLIMAGEGLELEAYPDPASPLGLACTEAHLPLRRYREIPSWEKKPGHPWTIGYGHTGPEVHPGMRIGVVEAEATLRRDVSATATGVDLLVKGHPTTQGQFDSLVSFAYNEGLPRLRSSTLLRLFLAGDTKGAADEFLKWTRAGGVRLAGLATRRAAERRLFLYGDVH